MFNTSERPDCLTSLVLCGLIFYRFLYLVFYKKNRRFCKDMVFLAFIIIFSTKLLRETTI